MEIMSTCKLSIKKAGLSPIQALVDPNGIIMTKFISDVHVTGVNQIGYSQKFFTVSANGTGEVM